MTSGKDYFFIDTTGQNIFKEKFELAYPFENGVARVKSKKWGIVSTLGYHFVANKYDYIGEFSEGQAVVGLYNSVGVCDLNGEFLIDPSFDNVYGITNQIFRAERSDAIGYMKYDKSFIWDIKK